MNLRISIDTLRIDLVDDEDNTIAWHKATLAINATGETQKVLSDIHAYIRCRSRRSGLVYQTAKMCYSVFGITLRRDRRGSSQIHATPHRAWQRSTAGA